MATQGYPAPGVFADDVRAWSTVYNPTTGQPETASATNPAPVAGPASEDVAYTLTRPADTSAYSIGDLIANNTAAGSVTPMSFGIGRANDIGGLIWRIRARCNITAWKAGTIRVHLFRNSPTVAVGDNGQLNNAETYAFTESQYLGYADVTLNQQTSDGWVKGFAMSSVITKPSAGTANIFGLLEARSAITPASGSQFIVTLEVDRD